MTFEARYRSRCDACGEGITPGDIVEYDDSNRVVHFDCEDDARTQGTDDGEVCDECWLIKPCECAA